MKYEIAELKKALGSLRVNFDKSSKDFSGNTKKLQNTLADLQVDFKGVSKVMKESVKVMGDSASAGNELLAGLRNSFSVKGNEIDPEKAMKETTDFIKERIRKTFPDASVWVNLISGVLAPAKASKTSLLGSIGKMFSFDTGGVVPGSFSQAMPIVAHGSEMVLNPAQQRNLFNRLNGSSGGKSAGSYVYAPQIKTGADAQEVFEVLNRHSRQFFAMISEGVQQDAGLRNAVKGC